MTASVFVITTDKNNSVYGVLEQSNSVNVNIIKQEILYKHRSFKVRSEGNKRNT